MKLLVQQNTTSLAVKAFIQNSASTTGAGLTGLAYNTASLTAYYIKQGDSSSTAISLVTATLGTWTSGGFIVADGTNMPGAYELGIPNAALTALGSCVIYLQGAAGMAPLVLEIQVVAFNPNDAVHLGLSALPNASTAASGGLLTVGTGSGQLTPDGSGNVLVSSGTGSGQLSVSSGVIAANATKINGVSTSSVTTINAVHGQAHAITVNADGGVQAKQYYDAGQGSYENFPSNLYQGSISSSGFFGANVVQWSSGSVPSPNTTGVPIVDAGYVQGHATTVDANNALNVSAKYWAGTAITAASIPVATTAGAAGGLFVAGSNAATTITGNAASGSSPATSGLTLIGGAASTTSGGVSATGFSSTGGAGAASTNGAAAGATFAAGGTTTVSGNTGVVMTGTGNGNGLSLVHAGSGQDFNATTTPLVLAKTTNITGFNDIAATAIVSNGAITTSSGAVSTVTNLTNAPTNGDFTSTMKTSIGTAVAASAVASVTAGVSLAAPYSAIIQTGTAGAGGSSTITIATALGTTADIVGCKIKIVSGTGTNQTRVITGYVNSTKVVTVDYAWVTTPDNTSVYAVLFDNAPSITSGLKVAEVALVDTLTTYTGNTPQTGDSYGIVNSGAYGNSALLTAIGAPQQVGTKYHALLTNTDVTGNLPADVQTIKTQTVTCSAGVTVNPQVGTANELTVDGSGNGNANLINIHGSSAVATSGKLWVLDESGNGIAADIAALQSHGDGSWATASVPTNFTSMSITNAGIVKSDLQTIKTQAVTCGAGVTINPEVGSAYEIATDSSGYVTINNTIPTTSQIATAVLTDTGDNSMNGTPGKILAQLGGAFTTQSSSIFATSALQNAPGGSAPTVEDIDAQLTSSHGSGAWGSDSGSGPDTVTITVNDGNGHSLQNVIVRLSLSGVNYFATTNSSGVATFYANDGTWAVTMVALSGAYSFAGASLVVSGDSSATYSMTPITITPSSAGYTTGYLTAYLANGAPAQNVQVFWQIYNSVSPSPGLALDASLQSAYTNSLGVVQLPDMVLGVQYKIYAIKNAFIVALIPADAGSTYELPGITFVPPA